MINFILDKIAVFFLHIQINTINLKYSRSLPRPRRANPFSRFIAKLFSSQQATKIVGLNLITAMLTVPLITSPQSEIVYEPPLNLPREDLVVIDSFEPNLSTQPRQYVIPVENLRYIGQGYHQGHLAYDLNTAFGNDVYAFTDGRVHKTENGLFGLGRYIILDHGHGLTSVYGHLDSFTVSQGDLVTAGDKIGEIGMTGNTTGPHLHFEIHDNGTPLNPASFLNFPKSYE